MNRRVVLCSLVLALAHCASTAPQPATSAPTSAAPPSASSVRTEIAAARNIDAASPPASLLRAPKAFPLPGVTGTAFIDLIAYERGHARVWIPVAATGSVDVFDTKTETFVRVDGFKTSEVTAKGKKRTLGPNSAAVGDGFVYVGNRGADEVCPVSTSDLRIQKCVKLPSRTDELAYAASTKEIWVTLPEKDALGVLDASDPAALKLKTLVNVDGAPEGYATDDAHRLFFTNLEDKGGTLVVDMATHKVKATWSAGCGADGPRGIALDGADNLLIVACTDHLQVLDAGHDGALLGKLEIGAGVDNIDYANGYIYAAASKAAKLTLATIDPRGQLTARATYDTAPSARNAVADMDGSVYVADSQGARLFVFASSLAH